VLSGVRWLTNMWTSPHPGYFDLGVQWDGSWYRQIALHGYPPRPARLSLTRTRAGWRIADIASAEGPSLLAGLAASNRTQKRR